MDKFGCCEGKGKVDHTNTTLFEKQECHIIESVATLTLKLGQFK